MPYVSVEHEAGLWVDALVARKWEDRGHWRLSVHYVLDTVAYCRVVDADQVRRSRRVRAIRREARAAFIN